MRWLPPLMSPWNPASITHLLPFSSEHLLWCLPRRPLTWEMLPPPRQTPKKLPSALASNLLCKTLLGSMSTRQPWQRQMCHDLLRLAMTNALALFTCAPTPACIQASFYFSWKFQLYFVYFGSGSFCGSFCIEQIEVVILRWWGGWNSTL